MTKDYKQLWKRITDKTGQSEVAQAAHALAEIVADSAGRDFISRSSREDAELCVEILDHGITKLNLKPAEKSTFLVTLRRLAVHHKLLPRRIGMTEENPLLDGALASGVPEGTWMCGGQHVTTTISEVPLVGDFGGPEELTGPQRDERLERIQDIRRRYYREVVLWSTLSHPNLSKLLAVEEDVTKSQFTTVSELMGGTIMDYIEGHRANRLELLHGAVQGLEYLHGIVLAHGDIKGDNIFVPYDEPLRACLAEFGFITTVLDPGQERLCSAKAAGGTARFMPPELLLPQDHGKGVARATQEADVYAFGLVIFQVLTGGIPFADIVSWVVPCYIPLGERPAKPENASAIGFSDSLWDFTERCWSGQMESRPKVGEVVAHLGKAAAERDKPMPSVALTWSAASSDDDVFDKLLLPPTA